MFWIQITLNVKKWSSKYGDDCFIKLIETPLYKDLNVTIHHPWASLFTLHMDLKFQVLNSSDASFDNFDFDSEKLHFTPKDLMIHNLLEVPKK